MTINEKLKAAIKRQGFTISAVANQMWSDRNNKTGLTQQALSDMLKSNIAFNRVEEIAGIIGLTVGDIIRMGEPGTEESNAEVASVCPHCGKPINIKMTIE